MVLLKRSVSFDHESYSTMKGSFLSPNFSPPFFSSVARTGLNWMSLKWLYEPLTNLATYDHIRAAVTVCMRVLAL